MKIVILVYIVILNFTQFSECKRFQLPKLPSTLSIPGRLVPRINYIRQCKHFPGPTLIRYARFYDFDNGRSVGVEMEVELHRRVYNITQLVFHIYNCKDNTEGSCELFQTGRYREESCYLLTMKNQVWTSALEGMEPPCRCPFAPGLYVQKNATLDVTLLQQMPFPLEKYYWRGRLEAFDPEKVYCAEIAIRFLRSRS